MSIKDYIISGKQLSEEIIGEETSQLLTIFNNGYFVQSIFILFF